MDQRRCAFYDNHLGCKYTNGGGLFKARPLTLNKCLKLCRLY